MDIEYNPAQVESEIQAYWDETDAFEVKEDLSKEKYYALAMLPYPSGHLHMGHVRNYTIVDVIAHYHRMLGKNVLHPIGWDAFGLPAENAAIKHGVHPAQWTEQNIDQMREELKRLGFSYDWSREFSTCSPDYYQWEQWLFIKLYEKGLVYKKNTLVNWDPVDETVLANEQVVDGCGWRSGAPVERREISQWFLKITHYAEELLAELENLEGWPQQVRTMQKHWIGRSEGTKALFNVDGQKDSLSIFTSRADTLMGATYLAIAAEHPLAKQVAKSNAKIAAFCESCRHAQVAEAAMATMEKKGIETGLFAIHPITGEKLPIWIANFVLMTYASGAVMAVPAHDERDFEFAQKYQLPIQPVIQPADGATWDFDKAAYTDKGTLINSGEFDGLESLQAIEKITEKLSAFGHGKKQVHYRLRDWGVSRQRYWGTPIPMIYCPKCDVVPVPESDLPVVLPPGLKITGKGSPLATEKSFYKVNCPQCGGKARRETDTFDTFVESSWYYARYACPDQKKAMLDGRAKYWTPVDHYVGGVEHAIMHLLYARFVHKLLRDLGLLNSDEPFTKLLTQGMVLKDGAKMSKSKGNTVEPRPLIQQYGADTVRLFIIFAAPCDQALEWSDAGVDGAHRFLKRLWKLAIGAKGALQQSLAVDKPIRWALAKPEIQKARCQLYEILQSAQHDIDRMQLNTVVSSAMKLFNLLTELSPSELESAALLTEGFSVLLRLLAPITPHIAQKLWVELGYGADVLAAGWPKVDTDALQTETVTVIVQVNGKLRDKIEIAVDAPEEEAQKAALASEKIIRCLDGQTHKKVIVVPNRLISIVV